MPSLPRLFASFLLFLALSGTAFALYLVSARLGRSTMSGSGQWPGERLTYYLEEESDAFPQAAQQWNDAGLKVRFQQTDNRAKADVLVRADSRMVKKLCPDPPCGAVTDHVGYSESRPRSTIWILERKERGYKQVRIYVHELGHVLGLLHNDRHPCVVMRSRLSQQTCGRRERRGAPVCGPWPEDIRALAELYGRRGESRVRERCLAVGPQTQQ